LLIAVVLLLLAGIMTVLAMNVGIFEQRSTANDIRAKAVSQIAEAGLAQGAEYLLRQHPEMLVAFPATTAIWTPCGPSETTFPCGAVSDAPYDDDANAATGSVSRRGTMYRLTNSGASIASLDASLVSRMLPMSTTIGNVGSGFQVAYGVAPVACFAAKRVAGEAANSPIRCASGASGAAEASERRIVTFVSVASMVGENARATLTQTVGRYPLLGDPVGAPPIVASGSINVNGGIQIVTNPNAGGTGVPVSVWTRKNVTKTGTPNTCYSDEFFRFGVPSGNQGSPAIVTVSTNPTVTTVVCDGCSCNGDKSLSYNKSGGVDDEGFDILDIETGTRVGVNYNVGQTHGSCEFPPDLFAHIFGVKTWEDVDRDCFGEKKIMVNFEPPTGPPAVTIGADEAYLYANANKIINPTVTSDPLMKAAQAYSGTYPTSSLSGLIWCQASCGVGSNEVLGSPQKPVILVVDGSLTMRGKVYGLVFLRTTSGGTLTPPAGYTMTTEIETGGNTELTMNAGALIYGSAVIQGKGDVLNGGAAVIYNAEILNQINRDPDNQRYATLPGAWNDRSTY